MAEEMERKKKRFHENISKGKFILNGEKRLNKKEEFILQTFIKLQKLTSKYS